jgi:hypothetical protein
MLRPEFTRRDFLKVSAAGMLSALLAEAGLGGASAATLPQGRMIRSGIGLYRDPAFKADTMSLFGMDEVVEVTGEVDGDEGNPYNRKWFQINGDGYTYSGWVQPVDTLYQKPDFDIPPEGRLGEIAVPFSVSRLQPSMWARNGYRIYFATTHWVTGVSVNRYEKGIWYEIYDSHLQKSFYVSSADMRLVPDDELTRLAPGVPETDKHIYVDVSTQSVTAFEGETAVLTARCSSGGKGTTTPLGDFQTFHKGPTVHMTNDGEAGAGQGYDLPGVPWVSFFTGTGVSFHGTYWHNDYGKPRSHGCVNLRPEDAKFLYRWSSPLVPIDTQYLYEPGQGTPVQIVASHS